MDRLASYLQSFVDGQFYGVELFPLHAAQNIDSARRVFLCSCFDLPSSTSKNLTYALFPVMPALFLLLKRRASFYARAQVHDLACVREAFLFDMCQLYPHKESWTFQLLQIFRAIDVDISDVATFPRHLTDFNETMTDVETICFLCVSFSEDKTLSFFRHMPDVESASSFRSYLTRCKASKQNFLLLFLTSGLRWRFFTTPGRGSACPHCKTHFWSWEHFLSCPLQPVSVSVPVFISLIVLGSWDEISDHVRKIVLAWLGGFEDKDLSINVAQIRDIFQ
jgi:hypothetical protein